MEIASNPIVEALRERGYRITQAREDLARTLLKAHAPLSIQELARSSAYDEASVYRFIHTLLKENLLHEIVVRGERSRFEFNDEHHHHVVCTSCGKVAHVPCKYTPHVPTSLKGFSSIEDHDLTFYGRCTTCK